MITSKITESRIYSDLIRKEVQDISSGAIVIFSGEVRDHDKGKRVRKLIYEIHPTADEVLKKIAIEIKAKYGVTNISVAHRYGDIAIGESAFIVAVSSPHREKAFMACQELVERVKIELPIWKFQEFEDGSTEWVNSA